MGDRPEEVETGSGFEWERGREGEPSSDFKLWMLTFKVPNGEYTASTKATPSATPLPERDATVNAPAPQTETADDTVLSSQPGAQAKAEREDLGAVEWYYRDPNGQEQGEQDYRGSRSKLNL